MIMKCKDLPCIREICRHRNIMYPWLHCSIKEFIPFITNMKHKGITKEQMLETKTCCYSTEIEQVPEKIIRKLLQGYNRKMGHLS